MNIDAYYIPDIPDDICDVCINFCDECICPECLVCGLSGSAECYESHLLTLSPAQIAGQKRRDEIWAAEEEEIKDELKYFEVKA